MTGGAKRCLVGARSAGFCEGGGYGFAVGIFHPAHSVLKATHVGNVKFVEENFVGDGGKVALANGFPLGVVSV